MTSVTIPWEVGVLEELFDTDEIWAVEKGPSEWEHLCPCCQATLTVTATDDGLALLDCLGEPACEPEAVRERLEELRAMVPASPDGSLPPFPVDALPPALAEWVHATAIATQTPPDLAAGMALAALSTAALGSARVHCAPGWEEELVLWIVCVLPSGERKSAVLRSAVKPVQDTEREQVDQARPAIARERAGREALEAQYKALVRKVGDGKAGPGELADVAERLDTAGEPVLPRKLADDATPEALAGLLARHGSIGIMAAESALLDNLGGRYADGRANLHLACQAYSGESARIDRRGRESEHLERPLLALGLCVQPHVLRRIAADETMREQGFLARAGFLLPSSRIGSRDTDPLPVPDQVAADYHECIARVAAPEGGSVGSVGLSPALTLSFSKEAAAAFRSMRAGHEPRLAPHTGDLADVATWANRHPGRVARIAGLLHLAEHSVEQSIDAKTFAGAERIGEYLAAHARAALAVDPMGDLIERTVAWLREQHEPTITVRDLHRGPAGGGKGSAESAHRLAERLERDGYLRRLRNSPASPGGGRPPSPTYEVLSPTQLNGATPDPNGFA